MRETKNLCGYFLVVVVCVPSLTRGDEPTKRERSTPASVLAADLFKRVSIIGQLKIPLWQTAVVRGTWIDRGPNTKEDPLVFRITDINGDHLRKTIDFRTVRPVSDRGDSHFVKDNTIWDWTAARGGRERPNLKPNSNDTWEIVAFEDGKVIGFPDEALDVLPVMSQSAEWGLVTELVYLRVRNVK